MAAVQSREESKQEQGGTKKRKGTLRIECNVVIEVRVEALKRRTDKD